MKELLTEILLESWDLTLQMAPFLVFGFAMAGVLAQLISRRWVETHFAEKGIKGIIKAVAFGVPLPLCSCGVLPVAQSLRRHGASRGAVSAFLISTPQTGADSILATYSLMGWPFTIARVIADLVSGIACGFGVDRHLKKKGGGGKTGENAEEADSCCGEISNDCCAPDQQSTSDDCCAPKQQPTSDECCAPASSLVPEAAKRTAGATVRAILREGFWELPKDLARPLLLGLLLGGILTTVFPEGIIRDSIGNPFLTFLAVTLLSIPLYVCATGSIPLAYGLMSAGLSPGAALVFLIIGPATNTATVTTLVKMLGPRATVLHLAILVVSAWAMGGIFDLFTPHAEWSAMAHGENEGRTLVQWVSALIIVMMLAAGLAPRGLTRSE